MTTISPQVQDQIRAAVIAADAGTRALYREISLDVISDAEPDNDYQIAVSHFRLTVLDELAGRVRSDATPRPELASNRPVGGAAASNQYGVFKVHTPSAAQLSFVARLVAERVIPETGGEQAALAAFRRGELNKRYASDLIEWLLTLPQNPRVPNAPVLSEKQAALIAKLTNEKQGAAEAIATACDLAGVAEASQLPKHVASKLIDVLFGLPRATVTTANSAIEAGMYQLADGAIYKVQLAVHGSGHLYAKRLVPGEFGEKASFEYEAGAIRKLTAADRMSLEAAKAFGALYGTCCVCGRTLTDERSIEAGIGPVCSGRL
jgi:hypothetical protein